MLMHCNKCAKQVLSVDAPVRALLAGSYPIWRGRCPVCNGIIHKLMKVAPSEFLPTVKQIRRENKPTRLQIKSRLRVRRKQLRDRTAIIRRI